MESWNTGILGNLKTTERLKYGIFEYNLPILSFPIIASHHFFFFPHFPSFHYLFRFLFSHYFIIPTFHFFLSLLNNPVFLNFIKQGTVADLK